ncbi:hypothetical protein Micbo1qcDRAFT_168691 [Microdochium bolleyi]|uniref:Extracellular membrane protein CFEM domain-containing protein n=1 Tax=Microdochium bolleyi TaxID=196109 RepID=A0A136IMF1_9PEZI|nr:hypothetical protein Micbo1qcDRAFT_168691 [Microdochium bolleyi]
MAPAYLIGSWMVLASHALASVGHHHHHHAHLHHVRHEPLAVPMMTLPVPTEVVGGGLVLDNGRAAQTTAPASLGDSCGEVNEQIVGCSDIIPNFNKADAQQIGQCLCCDGTKFRPKLFEGKAAQCASHIKGLAPQSTDAINQWAGLATFCGPKGPAGDMAGVCTKSYTYKPPAPKTIANVAPPVSAAMEPACKALEAMGKSCMQETPGFGMLPQKSQALCYCYSSSTQTQVWIPDRLDKHATKCASWASVAGQSSLENAASQLIGFCHNYGDFIGSGAAQVTVAAAALPTLGLGGPSTSPAALAQHIDTASQTPAPGPTAADSMTSPTPTSAAASVRCLASWAVCAGALAWASWLGA